MHPWFQILAITFALCLHTSVFAQAQDREDMQNIPEPVRSCMLRFEAVPFSQHLAETDALRGIVFVMVEAESRKEFEEILRAELPEFPAHIYYVIDDLAECENIGVFRYPLVKK